MIMIVFSAFLFYFLNYYYCCCTFGQFNRTVVVWKGIQSKVTCVKWHPSSTNGVLALGTEDGDVGLYILAQKRLEWFRSKHK